MSKVSKAVTYSRMMFLYGVRYLAAYLAFFHEQLVSAAQAATLEATSATSGFLGGGGRVSSAEEEEEEASSSSPSPRKGVAYPCYPFCIRCMAYLANVVGCSSYREDLLERVRCSR